MSQGRPALAFEVRRASPSESPQALADRALALVDAGADALVVSRSAPFLFQQLLFCWYQRTVIR